MTPERPGFRPDIEGLRGIAILLVIAFHAGVTTLAGGFVGVDVFFVLSGYLISGLLAREVIETGDIDLPAFYARRARRLLPAFLVVLFATLAIALWLYAPIDVPRIASDGRAVALHYGNVLFAQQAVNYHAASNNPFLHTWSLAVEEQFYIIWPLLFAFVGRMGSEAGDTRRRVVIAMSIAAALSFVASLVVTNVAQPWAFFGMPTRIWEFALGGLAFLVLRKDADSPRPSASRVALLQIVGLAAIAVATLTFADALPYPGFAAALPALGAVAVILGGELAPEGAVTRALGNSTLQWFGRVSYSWYLWHWPLVGLGAVLDWKVGVLGKLAWSGAALILAVLTQRFVEERFRHTERFKDEPHKLNLVALGATAAAALIAWGALSVAKQRASTPAQRVFAKARVDNMEHECWGSLTENATAPCIFGDANATTTVVLMGDSHAEHWLPALDRIGHERHWKVYAMVKPACPVADIPDMVNARLNRQYRECGEWRRAKLQRILALKPSFVVLSSYDHYVPEEGKESSWNVTPATWGAGLRRTYSLLSSAGIPTVAMRDVSDVGFDVPSCLSRKASGSPFQLRDCRYEYRESLIPSAVAAQTAAARGLRQVALISMNDRICPTRTCGVVVRGTVAYRDDDHLTQAFSLAEAPVLGDRIEGALARIGRR